MTDKVRILLSLDTSKARRAWLKDHCPAGDDALVDALREAAQLRVRDNPRSGLHVAEVMDDLAAVWRDRRTEAIALHVRANTRRLLAEHKVALDLYEKAASVYRSLGLELEAARVAVGHLATLQYLGLYEDALAMVDWARDVFGAAEEPLTLGKVLLNQGNIFARLDRYQEARASYAEARAVFTSLDDGRHLAMVDVNEANVLTNLNDFRRAESLFKQAGAHFQAGGLASVTAQIDDNLAYLYFAQGDYQRALATFNRARETFAAQDDVVRVAYVDLHRSDIYLALNLWQETLRMTRTARVAFEASKMTRETAWLWLNEAAALAHIDGQDPPNSALARARQIFGEEQNAIWLAVTDLYQATFDLRRQNLASARENARRARNTFRQAGLRGRTAQCQIILGEIALLEKDAQGAVRHFSRGLAAIEGMDLPTVAYACRFGLGRAQLLQGQTGRALQHYRQAILDIERLQTAIGAEDYKISFLGDKLKVFEALILLCLDLDTPHTQREAFEMLERAKSRALLDALARETPVSGTTSLEADLLAQMESLKSELNWHYNRLYDARPQAPDSSTEQAAQLSAAITERERALSRLLSRWRSPDLAKAPRNPVWTVTPSQIQAVLPVETMLLEFYFAHDQVIIFALSREVMWTERLAVRTSEVVDALGQLRFQMNKFSYGPVYRRRHAAALQQSVDDCLHRLYQLLLARIAERLTTETLIVVPHRLLHYVPFQALFDGERYLIDRKTISYGPSATILHRVLTDTGDVATESPLVLGLPDAAIPHAQAEVGAIAALFPEANVYLGEQATVSNLAKNADRPAFLHLATHAIFRADNPLFSALKLADDWFSVNDIYGLTDSAPLVTLSACETGRNQVAVGDELVGLCRGFFSAGAKSLVVSLWTVDDDSTARLMTRFYQGLQAGQPVNQALRSAQMMVKSEQAHPYYWAPFILTGNFQLCLPLISIF